jgi:hypothetical protein
MVAIVVVLMLRMTPLFRTPRPRAPVPWSAGTRPRIGAASDGRSRAYNRRARFDALDTREIAPVFSNPAIPVAALLALATFAPASAIDRSTLSTARSAAPTAKSAMVRVVHGSPDAGPVVVTVNGAPAIKNFLYGTITPYLDFKPGTYTLGVTTAGGASVTLKATIAAGKFYSIVATGELAPAAAPKKPNIALTAYADAAFGTGGAAINFHHAAPVVDTHVPFGFGLLASPTNIQLGTADFGAETGPLTLKPQGINNPIELYAVGVNAVTLIPNQIAASDVRNVLPFSGGANISAFAIDGPAAASDPTISGTDAVRLIGIFDANGK